MFSIPAKWNKRFWYSCSTWNSVFPTVVWHRFRIRKYSLFFELEKWHTYRKHFSTGRHTAQLDIGDLNRSQFTELNLVRNSKTSSRYAVRTNSTLKKEHTCGRWLLKNLAGKASPDVLFFKSHRGRGVLSKIIASCRGCTIVGPFSRFFDTVKISENMSIWWGLFRAESHNSDSSRCQTINCSRLIRPWWV